MSAPVQTSAVRAFPAAIQAWTPSCSTTKKAFVVFSLIVTGAVIAAAIWRWNAQESIPTEAADIELLPPPDAEYNSICEKFFSIFEKKNPNPMDSFSRMRSTISRKEKGARQKYIQAVLARDCKRVFFPEMKKGSKIYTGTFFFKLGDGSVILFKGFIVENKIELKIWHEDGTFEPTTLSYFMEINQSIENSDEHTEK